MRRSFLAVMATAAMAVPASAAAAEPGAATAPRAGAAVELGTLRPGTSTHPIAVNRRGEVVRHSDDRAFLWSAGVMTDLSALTGLPYLTVADINDRGEIAASWYDEQTGVARAVLIRGGTTTPLGEGVPEVVNERGDVAGTDRPQVDGGRPFRWRDGVREELDAVPGRPVSVSRVVDLDERGTVLAQVVGPESDWEQGHQQGYVWSGDEVTLLADPAVRYVTPADLNERGQVTGFSGRTGVPGSVEAFVWRDGRLRLLQEPEPNCFRMGLHIDDRGRVLVQSTCFVDGVQMTAHALVDRGRTRPITPPAGAALRVGGGPTANDRALVAGVLDRPGRPPAVGAWQDGRWADVAVAGPGRPRVVEVGEGGHVLVQVDRGEDDSPARGVLWTVPRRG